MLHGGSGHVGWGKRCGTTRIMTTGAMRGKGLLLVHHSNTGEFDREQIGWALRGRNVPHDEPSI